MKLLLNDTSHYHCGCAEVVANIDFNRSVRSKDYATARHIDYSQYNLVMLNGEGTMHHNAEGAVAWIDALARAQKAGCETWLINSVWQEMDQQHADIIKKCTRVEVREVLSQDELLTQGVVSNIVPDRSIRSDVPKEEYPYSQVYYGQRYFQDEIYIPVDAKRIDIFNQPWNEIVNRLRNSELLITGRHHEMYAAIKARCRFIVTPGSSWKNEGVLFSSSELPLTVTIQEALCGKWDYEYEKIFNWANRYESSIIR